MKKPFASLTRLNMSKKGFTSLLEEEKKKQGEKPHSLSFPPRTQVEPQRSFEMCCQKLHPKIRIFSSLMKRVDQGSSSGFF